jgi:UDP-galactopyranose mutase
VGEQYYPIPNPENHALYEKYRELALQEEKNNIYFVGRLVNYKYFNMYDAILNALTLFESIVYQSKE